MGIQIKDIIASKEIGFDDLKNRAVAVDTFNMLYQFLTTIRQPDGSPLTDSRGNVTSHLIGLFSRTTSFMQKGIRPIFVFDGRAPEQKAAERERRAELKKEAGREYEIAKERQDIDAMKKYASRTSKLTPEMVDEAKKLIVLLGLPVVQAKSEGEAQAAYLARKGDAFATVSQDFDTLLHGSPRLVRNLSVAGKRKKTGKIGYDTIRPEIINLSEVLNSLRIDNDQLIALSLLVGTDYNVGGIKGLGQKKALSLVQQHGKDFDALFRAAKWDDHFDTEWSELYYLIKNMPVEEDYEIRWGNIDYEGVSLFLCREHDFSEERVWQGLEKLRHDEKQKIQKGLGDFF